jgi:hypothetical protein
MALLQINKSKNYERINVNLIILTDINILTTNW